MSLRSLDLFGLMGIVFPTSLGQIKTKDKEILVSPRNEFYVRLKMRDLMVHKDALGDLLNHDRT